MSSKRSPKKDNKKKTSIPKVPIYKKIPRMFWQIIRKPRILAVIFISFGIIIFFKGGSYSFVSRSIDKSYVLLSKSTGLVLKEIYQEGVVNTNEEDLIKALNIKMGQSIFLIDLDKIRKNVESLPWVKYATVELLYPSTLSVRMIEHKVAAIWQNKGVLKLIDLNGNVISDDNIKKFSNKIILVGSDVPENSAKFLNTIKMFNNIYEYISSATRVSNRRWDVYLKNNILIKLPEDNIEKALKEISRLQAKEDILSGNIKSIDLKLENKIFIKNKI